MHLRILFGLLLFLLSTNTSLASSVISKDDLIKTSLRQIGHQLLLNNHDSSSRVLPIQKVGNTYKLTFEDSLSFDPGSLASLVENVVVNAQLSPNYLVDVQYCGTDSTVYSYSLSQSSEKTLIPCKGRIQPKGCYAIYVTFFDSDDVASLGEQPLQSNSGFWSWWFLCGLGVLLALLIAWYKLFKSPPSNIKQEANTAEIGTYTFNPQLMKLNHQNKTYALSGKESSLLQLLIENTNQTVERDYILQQVWGDEGGYVGRTLDVFISKLRKKLERDPKIKIANIRGVGYKLLVE